VKEPDTLEIGQARLELCHGDIARQDTEAIGIAANSRLAEGGGVVLFDPSTFNAYLTALKSQTLWKEGKSL
jgi:O-acetyl-ADP-ribose deacetylase (regulator of RNase III)